LQRKAVAVDDVLYPTREWFTEGFGTADLKKAKPIFGDLK
jgi:hypothetical protein|tara:strand:+ start:265 stop:384 length:120 start_codon:yes stop_codon:yes gene_type:complete